jgi:hypothetical protein
MNLLNIQFVVLRLALALTAAGPNEPPAKSPDQVLPAHITRLTLFGERADFSHDGKRVLFVEKTFGDAYEIDLRTRGIRLLTAHYKHLGYTRALYLANGDILLSGPKQFDPNNPGPSRAQCYLYVLDKDLTKPPTPLGTKCSEGPAVSRKRMHIAWTHVAQQYPDEMPPGSSRIYEADIMYEGGVPKLGDRRLVLDSRDLPFKCTLECQNFRPPGETELIFSAYGYPKRPGLRPRRHLEAVARRREGLDAVDLLQQVPRVQGLKPRSQRRRPVRGVSDGEVARPGGRGVRHLSLRLHQGRTRALSLSRFHLFVRRARADSKPPRGPLRHRLQPRKAVAARSYW